MAKGKNIYAGLYCTVTGALLKTVWFNKSQKNVTDFDGLKRYSPKIRKRVEVKAKVLKKSN